MENILIRSREIENGERDDGSGRKSIDETKLSLQTAPLLLQPLAGQAAGDSNLFQESPYGSNASMVTKQGLKMKGNIIDKNEQMNERRVGEEGREIT